MTQHSHQSPPSQLVTTSDFTARNERIRCLSHGVVRRLAVRSRSRRKAGAGGVARSGSGMAKTAASMIQ
jgi:hypothetical protein